jgi:signal transduction histidine kinase
VLEPYFTTKAQGTGLGLSLVQRTMLLHGGSVELEDRTGGGARVVLTLPLEAGGPGGGDRRTEA